jgi:hypothetical protein
MKKSIASVLLLAVMIILAGCQTESPQSTPTPAAVATPTDPIPTSPADTPAVVTATSPAEPEVTEPPPGAEIPDEEILILSPGPGSRVTNPIRLSGEAESTFEQNLVIRVLLDDGTQILETFTTMTSELGERGPFEAELQVPLEEERNIFIQVFSTSARDGGVVHLSSVVVMFSPTGPENIVQRTPEPEQITIFAPRNGDTISGVQAVVEGYGLASFEQTLVVEVYNEDGVLLARSPVMVDAPDLGLPGPFRAEIAYELDTAGPGRILVRDISPAHGGDTHVSSVEVNLQP